MGEQYNDAAYNQIISGIKAKNRELVEKNESLKELSENKALMQREYYRALKIKTVELKQDKEPATLILQLAKGDEVVSEARLQRDIAKDAYDIARSSITSLRLQIESYRTLFSGEREERFSKNV